MKYPPMNLDVFSYLLPYGVSFMVSWTLLSFAWGRRSARSAPYFILMTAGEVAWIFFFILETTSSQLSTKLFWDNLQWLCFFVVSYAWLVLVLSFLQNALLGRRGLLAVLALPFVVYGVLLFTNPQHGLTHDAIWLEPGQPFDVLLYDFTPLTGFITFYAIMLFFFASLLLWRAFGAAVGVYRTQIAILAVGPILQVVLSVIILSLDLKLLGQRDPAPLLFTFSNVIVAWGLFRYSLFNVLPIARNRVVDSLRDIVVIVDMQNRVLDMNPAAAVSGTRWQGMPLEAVFPQWMPYIHQFEGVQELHTELANPQGQHVELTLSSINDAHGQPQARIIIVRDITRRKHAENELATKHAELEQFFSLALDLFCIANTDGEFVKLNKAWENILGYTLAELEGKKFVDFVHPDDLQATQDALGVLGAQYPIVNFTNRYRHLDGSYRYIEWRSHPHGDLIYAAARDITARKKAETHLKEAQQIARMGYWELDWASKQVIWSEEHYQIFNIPPETPITLDQYDALIHPDDRAAVQAEFADLLARRVPTYTQEYRVVLADGVTLYIAIRVQVSYTAQGTPQNLFGITQDITERRAAEEALRQSEERYRAVINSQADLVCRYTPDAILTFVNDAYCQFHNKPAADLIGKSFLDNIPADYQENIKSYIQSLVENPRPSSYERLTVNAAGERHWFFWSDQVITDENGQAVEFQAVGRNIDALKQAEEALRQSEAHARALLNTIPDSVYQMDSQGVFLDYKAELSQLYSPPDQIIGHSLAELMPADFAQLTLDYIQKTLQTGITQSYEYQLDMPQRGLEFYEARLSPSGDQKVVAIVRNITERKAAEEALRQSETQARALLNTIPDLVFQVDPEGRFLDYKADLSELYSPPDQIIGRSVAELMPAEAAAAALFYIQQAVQTGATQYYEYQLDIPQRGLQFYEARLSPSGDQKVVTIVRNITERKAAEEARRQSEERFRKAFEESPIGMALISLEGEWQQVNPAMSEMLGYSEAELQGIDFQTITHPDDLGADLKLAARLLVGEIPTYRLQKRYIHKNGTYVWGLLSGSIVRNEVGDPLYFIAQIVDISEIKRLEESLRVLERAVNFSSAGTAIIDATDYANMPILYVNDAFTRISGYPRAELIGQNIRILNRGELDQPGFEEIRSAIRERRPCTTTVRAYRKDGSPFWNEIWLAPVFDEAGKMTHFVTTQLDVTERVESQQYLQGVLDSSISGVMAFRAVRNSTQQIIDFEWTMVNKGAESIVGRSEADLLGKKLLEEMPGNLDSGLFGHYKNTVETGAITDLEHFYDYEGLQTWFHTVAVKLGDGFVVTFNNITERIEARRRRAELIAELEAANQDLKDFAYIVSHDLKAPLRGIGSIANWLQSDYGSRLDDEGRELLDLLGGRVQRMDALITGILEYSRIGRVQETPTLVNLAETVQQICELLVPSEGFTVHITDPLPTLFMQPTPIQQVFQNLIGNAVKHMGKPQGEIWLSCQDEGDAWRFGVQDNGPGIEERHFARVFQVFQTLVPRDERESTGIGLSIVKRIIENHGGKIWIESIVGTGSTFYFTLPKKEGGHEPR